MDTLMIVGIILFIAGFILIAVEWWFRVSGRRESAA